MLFLLEVLLYTPLDPDDASDEYKGHRRENDKTVVHVSGVVERFGDDLDTQEGTGTEELAEDRDNDQNDTVTGSVGETVKK